VKTAGCSEEIESCWIVVTTSSMDGALRDAHCSVLEQSLDDEASVRQPA
jgi:hypothetical protein